MAGHVGLRLDTDHFYCRYARRQENKCPVVMRIKNNKQTGEVLRQSDIQGSRNFSQATSGARFLLGGGKCTAKMVHKSRFPGFLNRNFL
jgi:hypothetical protein